MTETVEEMYLLSNFLLLSNSELANRQRALLKFYKNDQIHKSLTCLTKSERARRAQSQQNVRARQQNREPRARGLALKKGLCICAEGCRASLPTTTLQYRVFTQYSSNR